MATTSYITPITDRTYADVEYAKIHQNDLENKNKGAWNYTDLNRVCNNLKYAAEYMYDQGFLSKPYQMQIKTDWKESDIVTYEQLNSMIINNMNNLKTYSRDDLEWYYIPSIANMTYSLANWIEKNIHQLATQQPLPADTFKLTVRNGAGSGDYESRTLVNIYADIPSAGTVFSHWSGDHLENIEDATAPNTRYEMPNENVTLTANYTSTVPHKLTVITQSINQTTDVSMGTSVYIEADPAPQGKVFHHWIVEPSRYEDNLYEPAASTHFTMPSEDVTLTAFYITRGEKEVIVINGETSGWYEYDAYASIRSNKPIGAVFTGWSGDVQYLTSSPQQEYNSVRVPDATPIKVAAHWIIPPVTDVPVTIIKGTIQSVNAISGKFTEGEQLIIKANTPEEGYTFQRWKIEEGDSVVMNPTSSTTTLIVGKTETVVKAYYRPLEYHTLTVTTNSGTTTRSVERYDTFTINANPPPDGYLFKEWTGDVHSLAVDLAETGAIMGMYDRNITATYRPVEIHTLTVKQLSGDVTYTNIEPNSIVITAEDAPTGKAFIGWTLSGKGKISSRYDKTITYTFGNNDDTLTPKYKNLWTITVVGGTINGHVSQELIEGSEYELRSRGLAQNERFDGWTVTGPGTISNAMMTSTKFIVGNGDATINANTSFYPDKTLTVYWRHPYTGDDTLISSQTYEYGTYIGGITAAKAVDKTTFLTWLGDTTILYPSALVSTVEIKRLTADTTIIATYYYPEAEDTYALTVYNGYPQEGTYKAGSQIEITADEPSQGYEFYKWIGDTQFIVNQEALHLPTNSVIMPKQAVTLYAKFKVIGELPLFRVSVENGIASGTYITDEGTESEEVHEESGVYIDVPAGTIVTLTADADVVGYTFNYWDGNFTEAGVDDIIVTNNPATFTMVENDLNIQMVRKQIDKYTIFTTNATGGGEYSAGTYPIAGNLVDTANEHYTFTNWTCEDADHNNCISAIANPSDVSTTVTLTDKDLWVEAHYITNYKLTVISGQDTGDGYYYEGETISTITADNAPQGMQFDYWSDPMGVISGNTMYSTTPIVVMKNSVATITAVYVSTDATGNSIGLTNEELQNIGTINRSDFSLINGIEGVGTIIFDEQGSIGILTEMNPDQDDSTSDFVIQKLFYGGNF